jgi:SAM-dependent methyltransferase
MGPKPDFIKSCNTLLILLLILSILLIMFMYFRSKRHFEGFSQKERYTMNRGQDAYDDFYAGIYDLLYKTDARAKYEAEQIIAVTQPDTEFSRFLDIGCGTGCLVETVRGLGYQVVGVDKSAAMIRAGQAKRPACELVKGDAQDAMSFDRGSFTHILCMNNTIYELKDKVHFFRNCAHWLRAGGYLIVHLVDPARFDPIIPIGNTFGNTFGNPSGNTYGNPSGNTFGNTFGNPSGNTYGNTFGNPSGKSGPGKSRVYDSPQEFSKSRITGSIVDFIDFKYKSAYDFDQVDTTGTVVQVETFTDTETNHVRQNEHTLYMAKERDILAEAQYCGFVLAGQFTMERYNRDAHQTVYILQKM